MKEYARNLRLSFIKPCSKRRRCYTKIIVPWLSLLLAVPVSFVKTVAEKISVITHIYRGLRWKQLALMW